jgi:hypothetical protein
MRFSLPQCLVAASSIEGSSGNVLVPDAGANGLDVNLIIDL